MKFTEEFGMIRFKEEFEKLGYTFQNMDVLEDVYTFYKYYDSNANEGVASILLEGDPGCGKTYLSEIFSKFLGSETEYLYTQCVDETNSERLISTYNVPAIVKGDADKSIAEGILIRAINLANSGKKVVLTIDELDKARDALDSYFLNFLQKGKIETSDNKILSLTIEGIKNLYVIFAKNNERDLVDALLRRCSVIKLPPMPPLIAYKTLLKRFTDVAHDPKFLKFVAKVYEAIYNEQMDSNEELLSRLPALQELSTAISSDNELFENNVSSTRRIKSLIRKIGKDSSSRKIITNILTTKFKYQNQESNYADEALNLDMDNPDDYMSAKNADSLVEQYIEQKDSGEYIFVEDELDDPMRDVADILDNMRDDKALSFLNPENREKIVELGVITHSNPRALDVLFEKIKFKGNPNSRFGFLSFENDDFVGLMKYRNTLILIANREYVSPKLLIQGLSSIITIIYDYRENVDLNSFYFSELSAKDFKMSGFDAKILSYIPDFVLSKMQFQNGIYTYQTSNLKVVYDPYLNPTHFRYLQKFRAEPLYDFIEKICRFNPELAIPASFINAKMFDRYSCSHLLNKVSYFECKKEEWEKLRLGGWEVQIDDFDIFDFSSVNKSEPSVRNYKEAEEQFVFDWNIECNESEKRIHIYPKYRLNGEYLLYTSDADFENNKNFVKLNSFQKEIALVARLIFGNFILQFSGERSNEFFSALTMSQTGRLMNDVSRNRIPGISQDITIEPDFKNYYDFVSSSSLLLSDLTLKRKIN